MASTRLPALRASQLDTLLHGRSIANHSEHLIGQRINENQSRLHQRIALLAMVGESLLCEDRSPLDLVAVNESAIGAIFQSLEEAVAVDIELEDELEDPCYYRQLILDSLSGDDDELRMQVVTTPLSGESKLTVLRREFECISAMEH